jgi:hypothetical protein
MDACGNKVADRCAHVCIVYRLWSVLHCRLRQSQVVDRRAAATGSATECEQCSPQRGNTAAAHQPYRNGGSDGVARGTSSVSPRGALDAAAAASSVAYADGVSSATLADAHCSHSRQRHGQQQYPRAAHDSEALSPHSGVQNGAARDYAAEAVALSPPPLPYARTQVEDAVPASTAALLAQMSSIRAQSSALSQHGGAGGGFSAQQRLEWPLLQRDVGSPARGRAAAAPAAAIAAVQCLSPASCGSSGGGSGLSPSGGIAGRRDMGAEAVRFRLEAAQRALRASAAAAASGGAHFSASPLRRWGDT